MNIYDTPFAEERLKLEKGRHNHGANRHQLTIKQCGLTGTDAFTAWATG